jgi:hypothetical protein
MTDPKIIIQARLFKEIPSKNDVSEKLVDIKLNNGFIELRRLNSGFDERVFVLDPKKYFKPWTGAIIYWSGYGDFLYEDDMYENPNKDAYMRYAYACHEGYVCGVGWGETENDLAMICFKPCVYSGIFTNHPKPDKAPNIIDSVIPGFAEKRLGYIDPKRNLIKDISSLDSLSSLEKQVDILSLLVFEMYKKLDNKQNWFEEFENTVMENSSLSFKNLEDNINNFAKVKQKLRNLQVKYFENRKKQ